MASRDDCPVTPAVRCLRERRIPFRPAHYPYEEHGGTAHAARCLGADEHAVIKTLIFRSDPKHAFVVLMHGDREVSAKSLARQLGVKQVAPADPAAAQRLTGYTVGGISPFGQRSQLPIYVEATILDLPAIWINGGKRGFLLELDPRVLREALGAVPVTVAVGVEEK
jgi:Cys-tRNA(Pro) deacylase